MTSTRYSTVLPGDRAVARVGDAVLVVDVAAVGGPPHLTALMDLIGGSGDLFAAVHEFDQSTDHPAFAVVAVTDSSVRAVLRGSADTAPDAALTVAVFIDAATSTPEYLIRAQRTALDQSHDLPPGAVVTVTVGPPPAPELVCGPTALHLRTGAVPGAGAVLWSDRSLETQPEPDAPTDELLAPDGELVDGPQARFVATEHDLAAAGAEPVATRTGPLVEGRRCAFGHLNAPAAGYCSRCGAIVDRRAPLETATRPPLGYLVADDGAAYVLEDDLVIGRDPAAFVAQRRGRSVHQGRLVSVVLHDRTGSLSRAHLEIRIEGWQVFAVDAGSANGTWVRSQAAPTPRQLPPGRPVPITSGTEIRAGSRVLRLQDATNG